MAIIDVELSAESQTRYLTYALSVVSSRALPDVRDGLKPVQRRILYAMANNLNLTPDRGYRKSAAVVGEVLARFHPHGDSACYDAMVRMAQDFSLRYPLVDGQGNFGSLDGDAAAAYRYTEARLTNFAMEVIGDIGQATVVERENFDQTTMEPVVLPSRVPNLLVNGASGIAVGMATAIPPHNLRDVVKALLLLIEAPDASDAKLISAVKGPDFPTGCLILNTPQELREIYTTGKGAVRMRSSYKLEKEPRGKEKIIITSIPYAIDKSALVEKIADLIIARKVPQLVDVRDESTDEVRIVLELASGADAEKALAYLFKQTTLQHNFNVNLTALIPSSNPHAGRPQLLGLRDMLQHFLNFRVEVTRAKLLFEKGKLDDRIHVLEGLVKIFDVLDEVIEIVRKSEGRSDAATRLQKRFGLSERQALFIVDLRIYQLSRTSVDEIVSELKEKSARVAEIVKILASDALLKGEVAADLKRVVDEYGDARRSEIVNEFEEPEFDKEDFVQHEQVHVVVTQEGWMKRIRTSNDPNTTRMREGDSLLFTAEADTRDMLVVFSNLGNVYGVPVFDLAATPGFGEPVQKVLKFADSEQILSLMVVKRDQLDGGGAALPDLFVYSVRGFGFRVGMDQIISAKRSGKRLMKLTEGDTVQGIVPADKQFVFLLSALGYGLHFLTSEVPKLNTGAKGVFLQKLPEEDRLIGAVSVGKGAKLTITLEQGSPKELELSSMTIMTRARRGDKVIKRGTPVAVAVVAAKGKETVH